MRKKLVILRPEGRTPHDGLKFRTLHLSIRPEWILSVNDANQDRNNRKYEKYVNDPPDAVHTHKTQKPQDEQDERDGDEHI